VRGRNYLIPVGADIETEADVEYAAVDAGLVLRYMEEAEARFNIVILDACRDNPYERSWRSASRGLVRLELPQGPLGSLLAYSTGPGKVAADGTGRNSPFTKHLLLNLRVTDLDLEDVFKRTRIGVSSDTGGRQIPWSESSLLGDFYFQRSILTEAQSPVTAPRPIKRPPQKAKLTVRSNVYGDLVYIDDKAVGSTRLDVELTPGKHRVRVEKDSYELYEKTVELKAGDNRVVRAILSKVSNTVALSEAVSSKGAAIASAPKSASQSRQGETWTEPITGMEFVWIPKGCFEMGSPKSEAGRFDKERQHRVCVEGFWLGKHEVTNAQYRRFRSDHESGEYQGQSLNGDDQPVVQVNWQAATDFAAWLSKKSGERFRLPSEAEWEYAARANTDTARYWGDSSDDACTYANVHDNTSKALFTWTHHDCHDGYAVTAPVGQFRPNLFGLYDILGNAWEWTCSVYDKDYSGAEKACASKGSTDRRVIRGGGWTDGPRDVRSAGRGGDTPDFRDGFIGFRLARTP